jgi:hypothetical protein
MRGILRHRKDSKLELAPMTDYASAMANFRGSNKKERKCAL